MPELPEVEVIRRNLETVLKGDTITNVTVFYRPIVSNNKDFEAKLINQKIHSVERQGKYLKFILDDYCLISHLRMEGKYFMDEKIDPKHTHVVFQLKSGHELSYHDTRKFGRFELIPIDEKDTYLNLSKKLAKDPDKIDFQEFYSKIKKSHLSIKELLLDQSVIAGIGNIYANEILYLSKIHPDKRGFLISINEAKEILENSIKVLNLAIKMGGSTIDTFESLGHRGKFQQYLNVHGKENQNCPRCGEKIIKIQHKGRGTYFCPSCQKSYVIGLTGGIATGKSTVSNYLKKLKIKVIDADQIVHNLYQDHDFLKKIDKIFKVLEEDKLNKEKLKNEVFNNKRKLKKLESIIHPLVFEKIEKSYQKYHEHIVVLDIPLLFETNYQKYDQSLLIYTNESIQIDRLMKRNHLTRKEAIKRIRLQLPLKEKKERATYTISNEDSKEKLYEATLNYLLSLK